MDMMEGMLEKQEYIHTRRRDTSGGVSLPLGGSGTELHHHGGGSGWPEGGGMIGRPSRLQAGSKSKRRRRGGKMVPRRYVQVFLCFLCTWVSYVERQGFSIAYTSIAKRVGALESVKGIVLAAFYCGYASSQMPGGWAAGKYGGWTVLRFSHIVWALCSALTGQIASNTVLLIFTRMLLGLAQGTVIPSVHTVLAAWIPPHEKARAVSFTTSGLYLGSAAAMAFYPAIAEDISPEAIPLMNAALAGLWLLLTVLFAENASDEDAMSAITLPTKSTDNNDEKAALITTDSNGDSGGAGPSKKKPELTDFFKSPAVWAIVTNNFTFHYAFYVVMNWLPTFIDAGHGIDLSKVGSLKIFPYILMFVVSNIGGIVGDYLTVEKKWPIGLVRKLINNTGFSIATIALLLIPSMTTVSSAIIVTSVAVGGCALARGGFAVNHMDIGPKYAGMIMGISNCAGTVSGIIGVSMSGFILDMAGGASNLASWRYVFGVPALLNVIGALHFARYAKGERLFD